MKILLSLPFAYLAAASFTARAADWSLEAMTGSAYNFASRLTLEQTGEERLAFDADFATRPFDGAPYYALRLARREDGRAWELSFIHHKLYLEDPPRAVDAFSVSHGFNIITLNRALDMQAYTVRVGAGAVVTHTEAGVRGANYDGPYELAGAALLAGISRRIDFGADWFLVLETLATAAYAESDPAGEAAPGLDVTVSNAAVHAHLGIGYDF